MKLFSFRSSLLLPRPLPEIFAFFSDAHKLEEITPPWLKFRVITPAPIEMSVGAQIDYRLKVRGFPIGWTSRITAWDPPHRFVDEQLKGPYRQWIHEHRFAEAANGTLCEDYVQYAPPGGAIVNALIVRRDVGKIFEYRSKRLKEIFV